MKATVRKNGDSNVKTNDALAMATHLLPEYYPLHQLVSCLTTVLKWFYSSYFSFKNVDSNENVSSANSNSMKVTFFPLHWLTDWWTQTSCTTDLWHVLFVVTFGGGGSHLGRSSAEYAVALRVCFLSLQCRAETQELGLGRDRQLVKGGTTKTVWCRVYTGTCLDSIQHQNCPWQKK